MTITEQAASELKKVLKNYDKPNAGIRIFSSEGCCGPAPGLDIAPHPAEGETVLTLEGINFFVANDLLEKMKNRSINFSPEGFRIHGLEKKGGCCN
ncbi:MAG: hypothetical protein ACP5DZ_10110 [Bacteroidales bacterium]